MKRISSLVHGYLDYVLVLALMLAPTLFGFGGVAALVCYLLAMWHGGVTMLTAFPAGSELVIPLRVHAGLDAALAVVLVGSPWVFGFEGVTAARNFYVIAGIALAIVIAVTRYQVYFIVPRNQFRELVEQ